MPVEPRLCPMFDSCSSICKYWLVAVIFHCSLATSVNAELPEFLRSTRCILFLGDSITHVGRYINQLENPLWLRRADQAPEMVNLGLPSATCGELSEPEHPFPHPDVKDRLQRALDKASPTVVEACYGMNDGIYFPFSAERFAAYPNGIHRLIEKLQLTDATLILMTPPAFDSLPLRKQGQLQPLGADKYA